ncbi:fumarylacetoacetate hydrolase family protein [Oceanobacillus sp. CAU 1775]
MKIISYKLHNSNNGWRIGCLHEDTVIDLQDAYLKSLISKGKKDNLTSIESIFPADPTAFFKAGKENLEIAQDAYEFTLVQMNKVNVYPREEVLTGTPIPNPGKIICVGRNYREHAIEMKGDIPEIPVLFGKFSNALIGPEDAIIKPNMTEKLDYEAELTLIIGKEASQVSQEDAYDYIAGYTIGNDTTARDLQKRTPQWLQGKTIDNTTPIGPWVVPATLINDPGNLEIKSYVNGEMRQSSNTSKFIFDIPYLIEFISSIIRLEPGDIIMTGTPDGVGTAMNPPQYLEKDDVVRIEIENIGTLENIVKENNTKA